MTVPSASPRCSVLIPAHDEAAVIERCLDELLADADPHEWEVVVAANGCRDDTVERVRRHGYDVRWLDLPEPGKTAAIRRADAELTVFPRIYLDADVVLSGAAARALRDTLDVSEPRAAAPSMSVDLAGCSRVARAYYRVWCRLPVFGPGYVGSGVYAVNEAGHQRLVPWPDVINDDEYVRRSFAPTERLTSEGCFTVAPARTIPALLRRGRRTRSGGRQLDVGQPSLGQSSAVSSSAFLGTLATSPRNWPDVVVFLAVTALARAAARRGSRAAVSWGRDNTSRGRESRRG